MHKRKIACSQDRAALSVHNAVPTTRERPAGSQRTAQFRADPETGTAD